MQRTISQAAAKVEFGRLHRNVPQKEIGSAPTRLRCIRAEHRSVADRAAQLRHSDAPGGFLHDVPNRLYRHPISPCPSYLLTRRNSFPRSIAAAASQSSSSVLTQSGTG